nr:uncharacterized mitochondrial protein AtMg00810-like [Tanacetum cinerariifolium]
MNYQPVTVGNQSHPSAYVQEQFDAEKDEDEIVQQYVLFPVWSSGFTNPQNTDGDDAFDEKEPEFEGRKPESEVNVSPISSAQSKKHDDKTKREAKGKIPAVGQLTPNSTNTFSVAGPSNTAVSPTQGKSSYVDSSQLPDDLNMPGLEDITYSDDEDDVGAEADFNNLETSITVSPIPTTRVHKDHLVTQIIGDLSSATQTRKEHKRVHQALKDPSWIEAMQEELLQFKRHKVWVLVDLPHRKRAIGHTHEERINYEEVFAPVARIEAISLFLAYASFMEFMVYQINVKSAFLYGTIEEENTDGDDAFDEKEPEFKGRKPESEVNVSPISSAQSKKHDDKTKREAKGKSHDNAAGTLVPVVGQLTPNSTNTFSVAGPSNTAEDITYSDDEDDVGAKADFNNLETSITVSPIPTTRVHKDHPVTQIIGDLSSATQTRSMTRVAKDQGGLSQINNDDFHTCMFACFLSQEEHKRVHQALKDPSWIEAMQEELLQFKRQKVWVLVDLPHQKRAIGFEDPDYPDKVYKVVKTLYGLHQAPRAWYETLANYLLENGFQRGKIDQTLFIKRQKGDILLVQLYVDDIIFGSTNKDLCKAFEKLMKDKFQMSSMRELTFFLGLQVKQKKNGIFISQDKYVAEILKKFSLTDGKSASTLIDTEKPLLKDPDDEDVDVHTYRSMISSLMYLTSSRPDIMSAQTVVATSSTEAEYIAVASCCAQVLWIQNQVLDYGLQALVDKKRVIITKATIRNALRLDDAEGIECLPNEEIFAELARMGYEKPSTKLTFYKTFFSSADEVHVEDVSTAGVAAEGAASVADDKVLAAVDEPSIPSPPPPTQPLPTSQDIPSTSQAQPTPPPSSIAQP